MPLSNTVATYGSVTKTLHWLVALLMGTQIALGIVGSRLGTDTRLDLKVQILEIHKLLGIAIFALALLRIVWTLAQPKPAPLHPERRVETFVAEAAHFALYAALLLMPLSGWIGHAASTGFAPIPWPFGQSLPLIPKSPALSEMAFAAHGIFAWILGAALAAHVAGALKHAVLDRDGTLRHMWFGGSAPEIPPNGADRPGAVPALGVALLVYAAGGLGALALTTPEEMAEAASPSSTGEWIVEEGTLGLAVTQFGSDIEGRFAEWSADISFSETAEDGNHGEVIVTVRVPSLTLGSVTENALGSDYMAAEDHPEATFSGPIRAEGAGFVADGTLELAGARVPVALPFTLDIDGGTARMEGSATIDRRDFGIGGDGTGQLAAEVTIPVTLTATRAE